MVSFTHPLFRTYKNVGFVAPAFSGPPPPPDASPKVLIHETKMHQQDHVIINFVCNHGKHRSVAMGELFANVFRGIGLDVVVDHKSLERHDRGCRCNGCQHPNTIVSDALVKLFIGA